MAVGAMPGDRRNLLVIGAQFSGTFVAREMKGDFNVTVVDAKEYMEYTPGILRAYVKPSHFEALSFLLEPILARKMKVTFILGEVKRLHSQGQMVLADIRLVASGDLRTLEFDYGIVCAGCSFGPLHKWGESLWFPTVLEDARRESEWGELDERYYEGRKQHILNEHNTIKSLNDRKSKVLVVGAGFIGVEWVTELNYFFRNLDLTVIDFLPRCLGPLPEKAANYCSKYMSSVGIKEYYCVKYDPKSQIFWDKICLSQRADKTYVCIGVKASNFFMPRETLSERGPGGGGWIHFNQKLQVTTKPLPGHDTGATWASGRVFAVGDCNYGCIGRPPSWVLPPIPKVSYPGEEQAYHACRNVRLLDATLSGKAQSTGDLNDTWWPWGAGMYATSLGAHDGCFVMGANETKGSGWLVTWWWPAAIQKDLIERTKLMECKDQWLGKQLWHLVHRTPVNLWGRGPLFP